MCFLWFPLPAPLHTIKPLIWLWPAPASDPFIILVLCVAKPHSIGCDPFWDIADRLITEGAGSSVYMCLKCNVLFLSFEFSSCFYFFLLRVRSLIISSLWGRGLFWLHGHPAAKILNYCSCVWVGAFKAVHKLGVTCIFENELLLLLEISTYILLLL